MLLKGLHIQVSVVARICLFRALWNEMQNCFKSWKKKKTLKDKKCQLMKLIN